MEKKLIKLLIISAFICSGQVFGQITQAFTEPDAKYQRAWEMYLKEKYGAAKSLFDEYLEEGKGSESFRLNATYYAAVCAYELFHPDAEERLNSFTTRYPESTKAPQAWFNLGRHYYRNKKYAKALSALEKADIYYLSGDEVAEYYFKLGYCQFNKGDNDKAAKSFKEILEVKSKYQTAAQYYYGHLAYQNGNTKTAIEYFSKLDSSATFGPLVPYYIAQMHFDQGRYDEVIRYAVPVLKNKSPQNNVEIMRIVAESYSRTGDYKNALVYMDGYSQGIPQLSRDDRYLMGYCEYRSSNHASAIPHFERVMGPLDALEQNAWYHLGDCYIQTGNKASARNAFQMASKLEHSATIREESLFNYGKLSYELNLPGALTALRDMQEKYPKSVHADETNELLAELYLSTRNYKDALAALEQIKGKSTRAQGAYQRVAYHRGIELMNDKVYDKSIGMFEKAIVNDVDPGIKANALYWKAEILYKQEKYEAAVKQYRSFIFNPGSVNTPLYNVGHYNLGYCFFKMGNYNEAQSWFRKYIAKRESGQDNIYGDALLRTADCHYALRDFGVSIKYYNDAIAIKAGSTDYAYFQKGLIQGLQNEQTGKISTLTSLIGGYPKSRFRGDALFERGRAHMTQGDNDKAKSDFNALLRESPAHPYARKAQLNIALMLYNDKQDDQAIVQYKKVVTQYPGSPEATEALLGLKSIYVGNGEPEAYFNFVKEIPNASVSTGAQDSITYEAAEQQYLKGDFDNADKSFSKYLQLFPNGGYKLNASFYLAECQYRKKDYASALTSYEKVLSAGSNLFTEKSLAKAAFIHFNENRFDKAIGHYQRLEQIAELRENQLNAQTGLMRSYFQSKQFELAIDYAKKLFEAEKVTNEVVSEAHLTYARSAMEINDLPAAKREYSAIAKQASMAGAEAKYSLALIDYKMGNFKASQGKCYDVAKQVPSYDFWIAKSFILLADNCIALKDTFQAKATLQSILENYEKDPSDPEDIRQVAGDKLKAIEDAAKGEPMKPSETPEQETDLNKEQQD